MSTIFLSYRRSDSTHFTGRVYDRLVAEFGASEVFKDADSIPKGTDFRDVLAAQLSRCRVVVVVIGDGWVTAAEQDGTRRLDNPNDYVRVEIETALGRSGVGVIPVLFGRGEMPAPEDVPHTLHPLLARQSRPFGGDGRYDTDVSALIADIRRALDGSPPARVALPVSSDRATTFDRDLSWPQIARRSSAGARLIVLTGPADIGKTVTASAFARWHSPAAAVVVIHAGREFDELSLIEAVGAAFPCELYREGFAVQPFGVQRRVAVEVLAHRRAVVIFDGLGDAEFPRDPVAEIALGKRMASELTAAGLFVLITTQDGGMWADQQPIPLRGACPAATPGVVRGERPTRSAVGRVAQLAGVLRGAMAAVFGDPVRPRPVPAGRGRTGPLFIVCVSLLLLAGLSLAWAYGSGSVRWERMFYGSTRDPAHVPPLATEAIKVSPGPGMLVELARAVVVIIFFLLVVVGRFFAAELAALVPRPPWERCGPRQFGLRSLFRVVLLALTVWLGASTFTHHWVVGPRTLWMTNGNPRLQERLDAADPLTLQAHRVLPADAAERMNGEPPSPGEAGYEEYRLDCAIPYQRYSIYSLIMFAVVGPVVVTVCLYSLCSCLWNHLITQPARLTRIDDQAPTTEIENRFRYFATTYVENIDKYLTMLLILLVCWAFHVWLDGRNLTISAAELTVRMLWVILTAWFGLFASLVLAYQVLLREAGRKLPDGDTRAAFVRRSGAIWFFARAVGGSSYAWLCFIPLVAIIVRAAVGGSGWPAATSALSGG